MNAGLLGFVFIGFFNALGWGSILVLSRRLRKPSPLVLPTIAGFGFMAYAHSQVDLGADAQAGVTVVFIPIWAFPIIVITFLLSVKLLGRGPEPVTNPNG